MRNAVVALCVLLAAGGAQGAASARNDILDLAAGAMILTSTSEYGGGWTPLNLLDGSTESGWCSEANKAVPNTFVLELPQEFAIRAVAADSSGDEEAGEPGISARLVVFLGSTTSESSGFAELASFEVPKAGRREVTLAKPVVARWLKVEVRSNWGNEQYTELMELEAYGDPLGEPPKVDLAGVYDTNYGLMRLEQDGASVAGCYDWDGGQLNGVLLGRVFQFEWREDSGAQVGTAVMVVSASGAALNGVWYENGKLAGEWRGSRVVGKQPECTVTRTGGLASRLKESGKVVLYGITFASDSAAITPESAATLEEVRAALAGEPELRVEVAGHTDSTNTDAYNLQLSAKRAEAVVAWLVEHGIAASRLTSKGLGEAQPVADNRSASGRALNRRVELTVER